MPQSAKVNVCVSVLLLIAAAGSSEKAAAQDMLLTGVGGGPNSVRKGDIRMAAERHLGSGSTLAVAWIKRDFQERPVLVRAGCWRRLEQEPMEKLHCRR